MSNFEDKVLDKSVPACLITLARGTRTTCFKTGLKTGFKTTDDGTPKTGSSS